MPVESIVVFTNISRFFMRNAMANFFDTATIQCLDKFKQIQVKITLLIKIEKEANGRLLLI